MSSALTRLADAVEALRPPGIDPAAERAAQARYEMRSARLLALRMHVARYLVRSGASRPNVAVLESVRPPRVAGLWVPDMVDAAGGVSLVGVAGQSAQETRLGELRPAEVLVFGTPGAAPGQAAAQLGALTGQVGWESIPAASAGRVWCVDYDALFGAPDARLIDGVEALIRIVLPQALGANGTPPPVHLAVRVGA